MNIGELFNHYYLLTTSKKKFNKTVPKPCELQKLETDYSFSQLKEFLETLQSEKADPNTPLSQETNQWFCEFLEKRWSYIKNTNNAYDQESSNPVNQFCVQIARELAAINSSTWFSLLMPGVLSIVNSNDQENMDQANVTDFVLNDSNTGLIHVDNAIDEYIREGKMTKQNGNNKINLSEEEQKRVINHTKETLEYFNLIKEINDSNEKVENLGQALNHFKIALHQASTAGGNEIWREDLADTTVNQSCIDIANIIERLGKSQRKYLFQTSYVNSKNKMIRFKNNIWDVISDHTISMTNSNKCALTISEDLEGILKNNPPLYEIDIKHNSNVFVDDTEQQKRMNKAKNRYIKNIKKEHIKVNSQQFSAEDHLKIIPYLLADEKGIALFCAKKKNFYLLVELSENEFRACKEALNKTPEGAKYFLEEFSKYEKSQRTKKIKTNAQTIQNTDLNISEDKLSNSLPTVTTTTTITTTNTNPTLASTKLSVNPESEPLITESTTAKKRKKISHDEEKTTEKKNNKRKNRHKYTLSNADAELIELSYGTEEQRIQKAINESLKIYNSNSNDSQELSQTIDSTNNRLKKRKSKKLSPKIPKLDSDKSLLLDNENQSSLSSTSRENFESINENKSIGSSNNNTTQLEIVNPQITPKTNKKTTVLKLKIPNNHRLADKNEEKIPNKTEEVTTQSNIQLETENQKNISDNSNLLAQTNNPENISVEKPNKSILKRKSDDSSDMPSKKKARINENLNQTGFFASKGNLKSLPPKISNIYNVTGFPELIKKLNDNIAEKNINEAFYYYYSALHFLAENKIAINNNSWYNKQKEELESVLYPKIQNLTQECQNKNTESYERNLNIINKCFTQKHYFQAIYYIDKVVNTLGSPNQFNYSWYSERLNNMNKCFLQCVNFIDTTPLETLMGTYKNDKNKLTSWIDCLNNLSYKWNYSNELFDSVLDKAKQLHRQLSGQSTIDSNILAM